MGRIVDFIPSSHDVIVSRVLASVHRAIDLEFPNISKPPPQFGMSESTLGPYNADTQSNLEDSTLKTMSHHMSKTRKSKRLRKKPLLGRFLVGFAIFLILTAVAYILWRRFEIS